jgi:hypothetical protein
MKSSLIKRTRCLAPSIRCLLVALIVPAGGARVHAQNSDPFVGTWKWNAKASNLTKQRLSISVAEDNRYTLDDHYGTPLTGVADGTPQPVSDGATFTLKQVDTATWKTSYKGVVSSSALYTISADGQHMKRQQHILWADGGAEDRVTDWQRVGSGKGITGEWEVTAVDSKAVSKPFELLITSADNGALTLDFPGMKSQYIYRFDGKDYASSNPGDPKGMTFATKRLGDRAMHLDSKVNGTPDGTVDFELSSDGRAMTVRETNKGQPGPILYTMEKQ